MIVITFLLIKPAKETGNGMLLKNNQKRKECAMLREEQETTICWDAATKTADIFSADPAVIRKLDKLVAEYPEDYRCTKVDARYGNKFYLVPAKYIRFGKPASKAQIEAARRNGQNTSFSSANSPQETTSTV